MNNWDKIYDELCRKILNEGVKTENRTGIDTIKIPFAHFELDNNKEFTTTYIPVGDTIALSKGNDKNE